ncbi:unnamed protein product [Amoebophrya sp. A120]|nr:unnamed protein product [Amoebophrya sp. A120]|eukprot:GSA120T00000727001.1
MATSKVEPEQGPATESTVEDDVGTSTLHTNEEKLCWGRWPARPPKKMNRGALPKCNYMRRIKKRMKTGK